jgi:phage shock protein A
MGILRRISNIFRAKVNGAIDNMENPVELLEQKIRDMEESLTEAKISSAQILGNVHSIERKMDDAARASKEFDEKVKLALNKGDEELAKKALQKKLEEDRNYDILKGSYNEAYSKATVIKENLKALEEEIESTRRYRDEAAARYHNAEASKKVNEILANVETRGNRISLDDIERRIQQKEAIARGFEDLKNDSLLNKDFDKLKELDLDEELRKYKLS